MTTSKRLEERYPSGKEILNYSSSPKLLFVVVNKRVNTRFFMENKATGRLENPPSGTVVDTKVTLPER